MVHFTDRNETVRKRLLEKYSARESGTWRILGEDPNCDFGGHHHEPYLETVTGTYENVVDYALSLKGFFQWGAGGRIEKISATINVDKLNSKRVRELTAEKRKLELRLDETKSALAKVELEIEDELNKR